MQEYSLTKKNAENPEEGTLVFFEANKDISFSFKRVYYTYGVKEGIIRGHHAHKALEQLLICVYGAIEIMCDDGKKKEYTVLDDPAKGLYVGRGIWRTMKWLKDDSVLLVLACEYYDESDYIRDYDEFIRLVKEGYWKR
ncbi:sugar 3,4-ketoisomerase [Mesotoga sp. UBA5847]|jgi:dTDP-4-dehydrorhamnose 3,5-epimerase-like enzyme|uniref:sugar 3,4-ketoisomerase n=1 Tax=Mesotoga sp. UBA5847 TaxID=1946859 RepID=UPI0025E6CCA3|nr:FdtA/QdtA family cupin domain-containing protein [Mesotoga sp. UBA5847]